MRLRAFLVEAFQQLHARYDKINRTLADLLGSRHQMSILDLDRQILRLKTSFMAATCCPNPSRFLV